MERKIILFSLLLGLLLLVAGITYFAYTDYGIFYSLLTAGIGFLFIAFIFKIIDVFKD